MKKFWLTRFIILVYCAAIVTGCRTSKQQPIANNNDDTNDRQKRGMVSLVSTTTDTPIPGTNEAEQVSTTVADEISDNASITDIKSNENTTNILQEAEFNKDKRNEGGDNPLPSSDEEGVDEVKSRKTRQKTYKCYCEEASYRSDCLKKCQSAKQFDSDDYDQDTSIEMTEDPLQAYTNNVPRTTTESAKFSIPYAKNVNFDQRVILGNEYPQSYKLYSNPRIKFPKNQLLPIFPQTPPLQYAIAYPGMVRSGVPQIKQNYLTSALKKPVFKGTNVPSIIGRNFANIQECINLYGQTVCVIAPTTKSPLSNSEIATTVDFMTGNTIGNNINEIDEPCADNNQNQNMKSTGDPNQVIYQTSTISPLYEVKYPSVYDKKLKSSVKIDKLYSVGSNPPKLPNYYVGNKQLPYADHFNYGKKIFVNTGQNNNLQKSFNGKYYLNKNGMKIAPASSPNNNGLEKPLFYFQTVGVTTPRTITQKPVYATKYPFTTTPSYNYLDEYDKSRNHYSKEIVNSKESQSDVENKINFEYTPNFKNAMHDGTGQNYLQDTNIRQQTIYPSQTQQGNHDVTGYPTIQFQYLTTVPSKMNDYVQNPKFVTNQPKDHYPETYRQLNEIHSIIGDRFEGSQDRGISNYQNLLEQTTISPLLQHTSIYVTDQQKNDYQNRYEEKVVSSNVAKGNNFAQGLSRSNAEKDRKLFFSKESNYNSNVKEASSEINSHTMSYVTNSIPEFQTVKPSTEGIINIKNTLQSNSEDSDSSKILTSIKKEYDSHLSKPMGFRYNPQLNRQEASENVNYYKSDSAQSKDNELYYSSNAALEHEKYKNNERPQPQFDYTNFPQSMSRIINEANGQYVNNQYSQYRPGNVLKNYPNHIYSEPFNTEYNIHATTPTIAAHNYRVNSGFSTNSPNMNSNFNDYIAKTAIPKTDSPDPTSYIDPNIPISTTISISHTTPPSNYEYQDRYNTRLPLQSFNLKQQKDVVGHPERLDKAQIPNIKLSVDPNINEPNIQSQRKYPSRLSKQKIRLQMFNDTENLFRGLEQIILNNYDPDLSEENIKEPAENFVPKESTQLKGPKDIAEKILFGDLNKQIKENVQKYGQAGVSAIEYQKPNELHVKSSTGTENPIQSVDDIPATVRENINSELTTQATVIETPQQIVNEILVQNAIRKVINNFVPGKAEDLMKNAEEMVGAKDSDLLPEIVSTPVIRNVLSIPEVENMIVDVAGGFMGRITHIALGNLAGYIRKSFRQVVNKEIPQRKQTIAPFTVEEHRFQNGEWVTEQVSLLGNSKADELKSLPREVFDKIKSILYRSKLSEEEAAQPIVQNLIVKAVKHTLDNERGIVRESAIRKAFKIIVKPTKDKSSPSYNAATTAEVKKATIPVPEAATESYESYKLAPVVPITESNYHKGYWRETQKLLVDPAKKKISTSFDENTKQAIQKQLDKVKTIKVTSEEDRYSQISDINFETSSQDEYEYEDPFEDEDDDDSEDLDDEYSVIEGNAKETIANNINDVDLDRQPIKYYSPTDRVLEYIKTHQIAAHQSFSTTSEIIGRTSEHDTTTPMSDTNDRHSILHYEPQVPGKSVNQNADPKQSNGNQLNLYFESPKDSLKPKSQTASNDGRNLGRNNQFLDGSLTEYPRQSAGNLQTYIGRLIPADEKASQAKDLSDLENTSLVYVGDGVRLPLTIKKLPDGTFALTLSNEICKRFLQKQCPCCMSGNDNGFIIREQKSIKDDSELNILNNEPERTTENINSNVETHSKLHYKDKEAPEVTTRIEYLDANISPLAENQQDSTEQIQVAPSKVEENSYTNIYSRIRRESEEQKEGVQKEGLANRENFLENNIETSTENKNKALFINDANDENDSLKDRGNTETLIDNNESESYESQYDYQQEEPFDLSLQAIPGMLGPYRYQQLYAKENADALRNMFYMLHKNEE